MKKNGYLEKISVLFFIGLLIGLLAAYFLKIYYVDNYRSYFSEAAERIAGGNLHYGFLFFETAKRAILPFLLLLFAYYTSFGIPTVVLYTLYMGYNMGYFLTSLYFTFHVKGIFYGILYAMPQMLVYAPAMISVLYGILKEKKEGQRKKGFKELLLPVLMILTLLLAGAFLETFVNSWIMKKVVFLVS